MSWHEDAEYTADEAVGLSVREAKMPRIMIMQAKYDVYDARRSRGRLAQPRFIA